MPKRSTQKNIFDSLLFAVLIVFGLLIGNLNNLIPVHSQYIVGLGFVLSICVFIGIYSYWIISLYRRVMQSRVRNYLMLIGANIIFWVAIRSIKWSAFEFVIFEDRFLWYMYYIPMIMLSVLFLFVALCVGENEDYRPDKRWSLLYIPAVLLIIAVLTNDIHGLAFNIDITKHAYGLEYSHGIVYYLVLIFILCVVVTASVIIIRKFSLSKATRRKALWPILVITTTVLYTVLYIIKPTYGLGHYLDLTIFGCSMAIALLESFIRTGLIHSNIGHSECFAMANIRAQILDDEGETVYISENTLPITKADFETLQGAKTFSFNSEIRSQIADINGGYVAWNSDVSQISRLIKNLKLLNDKLYREVDLLNLENEQKSERARLRKLNDLHGIMLKEILPLTEKIKSEIQSNEKTEPFELKRLLFETSMTSTYIKRRVNLILSEQAEGHIYAEDIRYCFLESFQLLRLYEITCVINIINNSEMSLKAAMAGFDLYQNIIEGAKYNFEAVYVTYEFDDKNMLFAVQISGDISICLDDFAATIHAQKGEIKLSSENDGYHVSLVMPK